MLVAGCLEPGPTPMGPEASDIDPPDSLLVFEDSLALASVVSWEEARELLNPKVLFVGRDETISGFRAEPLWSFDIEEFQDYADYLDAAGLIIHMPPAVYEPDTLETLVWDNPDLERDVLVRLVRLSGWPEEDEPLASLSELGDMGFVGEPFHPADYEDELYGIPIPLDSMRAWIDSSAAGELIHLGLLLEEGGEDGLIRIYGLNASAPSDTTVPSPVLKISYFIDEQKDAESKCLANAQALSREDPLGDLDARLSLATGLPRYSLLDLDLPEQLADSTNLIFRARLYLETDIDSLVGLGPLDRDAGGLTLRILVPEGDWDPLSPAMPEEYRLLASAISLYDEDGELVSPLVLPLTGWVQDWVRGEVENRGLILALNGEGQRPRAFDWPVDQPGSSPRLEIFYTGRPDFE